MSTSEHITLLMERSKLLLGFHERQRAQVNDLSVLKSDLGRGHTEVSSLIAK